MSIGNRVEIIVTPAEIEFDLREFSMFCLLQFGWNEKAAKSSLTEGLTG